MNVAKIFIIGLDGATFDILSPLVAQGSLPHLKKLIDEGLSMPLESVIPPVSPPAWASFMTGKHPGKHGVFEFRNYQPDLYDDQFISSKTLKSQTLWQILSEKGKRVIAVNIPVNYPPYPVNGILVSGFDAPSINSDFTYPSHLREKILELVPDYKFIYPDNPSKAYGSETQFAEFIQEIKQGFQARTDVAHAFMTEYEWDVFMVHYQQVDLLQHETWKFLEPDACNEFDAAKQEEVFSCYRELDACLGRLLAQLEKSTLKIVLSDHGFGAQYAFVHINYFLEQWGFLSLKTDSGDASGVFSAIKHACSHSSIPGVAKSYRTLQHLKHWLCSGSPLKTDARNEKTQEADMAQRSGKAFALSAKMAVNWHNTQAVMPFCCAYGYLYLNLQDREPAGIIPPERYNAVCQQLITHLLQLKDPHTGKKVVKQVLRGTEVYLDSHKDVRIPDLIIVPNPGYGINGDYREQSGFDYHEIWGNHRLNGICIVSGDTVQQNGSIESAHLVDIAPTILFALGLAVPTDMDGRVLTEIWNAPDHVVFEKTSDFVSDSQAGSEDGCPYSLEDEEIIAERLRKLGYLA